MAGSSTPTPRLAPLLLLVCLRGGPVAGASPGDHGLRCVTDYLLINCSLHLHAPSENASYWLRLLETSMDEEVFLCDLPSKPGMWSCSAGSSAPEDDAEVLVDVYTFEISLCHERRGGPETCELLDEDFRPVANIKPNAPCCLAVSRNSSRRRFVWRSTYEPYSDYTNLVNSFKYQLHYYKRGDRVLSHNISTSGTEFTVDDRVFEPDSEYGARVRSSPNQVHYRGQWSDWSPEVRWKTEPATDDPPSSSLAKRVLIPLCLLHVLVLLVLLLCRAPVKKWKQRAFIPSPAPYFHTLYSNCQGDFRSWVVTHGNTADAINAEETLHIDTLARSADVQAEDHRARCARRLMEGSGYSNVADPTCDACLLGSLTPLSGPECSLTPARVSLQSGNATEGDSGCWLCSNTSLEQDPPWYCNDYCTLSSFQQLAVVTAEHPWESEHPREGLRGSAA